MIKLNKPSNGWVSLQIEGFSCVASYVTNIPFDIMKASIIALKEDVPFCLFLHLEANGVVKIYSDDVTYIIHENSSIHFFSLDIIKEELIDSLVKQIKKDIDDWASFEEFEDPDYEIIKKNKKELLEKIEEIEKLWKNYEN